MSWRYETVRNAVERARKGEGPSLIECIAYRWRGHSFFSDLSSYRYGAEGEVEEWREKREPIKLFE